MGIGYFVYSNASSNTKEIDVTLGEGNSYFTPTNATAKLGDHVTFVVFNDDSNPHAFAIQAFNATTGVIQPSYSARMSFVANATGSFPFYSPLSADDASGMDNINGTFTVTQ